MDEVAERAKVRSSMPDVYERLDTWEALKAHVLEQAPSMARRLEELRGEPWRGASVTEAQVLAVLVALGLDPAAPADRRQARRLVQTLMEERAGSPDGFGSVRETPPVDLLERLNAAARERMHQSLEWLAANPPALWLANAAGANAAADLVRKKAPALAGLRAWQWLAALGYPAAVPDNARQRLLSRLGWIDRVHTTITGRAEAHRDLERLSHELATPVAELSLLLGAFAGAGDVEAEKGARCTPVPRCTTCPVRERCPYFAANRQVIRTQTRTLAATMRQQERPRERLLARGPGALSDEELLAILLRTGGGGVNVMDLANQILLRAQSIDRLAAMSVAEFATFPGVGQVKAITVKAALELARRLHDNAVSAYGQKMHSARRVFDFLKPRLVGEKKEQFYVLHLNTKLELIREVHVSTGTLNQSLVHPREVFAEAIRDTAHAVIFAHNHPTGDPAPSREDNAVTRKLVQAGDIVGISVLDHVIIGGDRFYSFADEGVLKPGEPA